MEAAFEEEGHTEMYVLERPFLQPCEWTRGCQAGVRSLKSGLPLPTEAPTDRAASIALTLVPANRTI